MKHRLLSEGADAMGGVVLANAAARVVWFPADMVCLTLDFLALTRWRMMRSLARTFGVMGPHSGPFCHKRLRCHDNEGNTCRLCGQAQRYRNREVYALTCRWVNVVTLNGLGVVGVCSRGRSYRLSGFHYTVTAVFLLLFWSTLLRIAMRVVL